MLTLFDHQPRKQQQGLSWMRPRKTGVYAIAYLDDAKTLVTGGGDGLVRIWDSADGKEKKRYDIRAAGFWLPLSHSVCSISVARRRGVLAHASQDGTLRCYSTTADAAARHEYAGTDLCAVTFSPDETRLACGHANGEIRVYAVDDALLLTERNEVPLLWRDALVCSLQGHSGAFKRRSLAWLDGATLVSAGTDERLRVWDVASGKCVFRSWLQTRPRAQRRRLLRSSNGGEIDLEQRFGGRDVVYVSPCVAVSPTAPVVATCSEQGARLWSLARGTHAFEGVKAIATAHRLGAKALEFTPDGLVLAMIEFADDQFGLSSRTVVTLWSVRTGLFERAFDPSPTPRDMYNELAISADGRRLAVSRSDGQALSWNIHTQRSMLVKCLLRRAAPRPPKAASPLVHLLFRLVDIGIASNVVAFFA